MKERILTIAALGFATLIAVGQIIELRSFCGNPPVAVSAMGTIKNMPEVGLDPADVPISNLYGIQFVGPVYSLSLSDEKHEAGRVVGIMATGIDREHFWTITMPCGRVYTYPINGLPDHDVPCDCGDPAHWVVKYEDGK